MAMTGSQFKRIREGLGWSQERMATEIGVSRVLVGQMERDQAPIESRTEQLVNRKREYFVDLGPLEGRALEMMNALRTEFYQSVPTGNASALIGIKLISEREIVGICGENEEIIGDEESQRLQVESIIREFVPSARVQIWDYSHKFRCGLVLDDGKKIEVEFVRRGVRPEDVRMHGQLLKDKIVAHLGGRTAA